MPFLIVLPMALTMNMGPQIVTDVTLLAYDRPVRKSLCYLLAVLIVSTVVTAAAFVVFVLLKSAPKPPGRSTVRQVIDYVAAGLLALLAVRTFLRRKRNEKPKWLSGIENASPRRVFVLGLALNSFMPTDLAAMLGVAAYLASRGKPWYGIFPFVGLTLLIAAMPLLFFLLLKKRAEAVMPRVRDWLETHSWIVNEIVIVFFICMFLFT